MIVYLFYINDCIVNQQHAHLLSVLLQVSPPAKRERQQVQIRWFGILTFEAYLHRRYGAAVCLLHTTLQPAAQIPRCEGMKVHIRWASVWKERFLCYRLQVTRGLETNDPNAVLGHPRARYCEKNVENMYCCFSLSLSSHLPLLSLPHLAHLGVSSTHLGRHLQRAVWGCSSHGSTAASPQSLCAFCLCCGSAGAGQHSVSPHVCTTTVQCWYNTHEY